MNGTLSSTRAEAGLMTSPRDTLQASKQDSHASRAPSATRLKATTSAELTTPSGITAQTDRGPRLELEQPRPGSSAASSKALNGRLPSMSAGASGHLRANLPTPGSPVRQQQQQILVQPVPAPAPAPAAVGSSQEEAAAPRPAAVLPPQLTIPASPAHHIMAQQHQQQQQPAAAQPLQPHEQQGQQGQSTSTPAPTANVTTSSASASTSASASASAFAAAPAAVGQPVPSQPEIRSRAVEFEGSPDGIRPRAAAEGIVGDLSVMQDKDWMTFRLQGKHGRKYNVSDLVRLQPECRLYKQLRDIQQTTLKSMPPTIREPLWYLQVDTDNMELGGDKALVSAHIRRSAPYWVRPIVLLPSLMRPPAWLRSTYTQLDENIHYGCKWGHRSRLEVVLQWVVERRRLMQDQFLTVWFSTVVYGPGEDFIIFGADSSGEVTDRPYVPAFLIADRREALDRACAAWSQVAHNLHDESERNLQAAANQANEQGIKEWIVRVASVRDASAAATMMPNPQQASLESMITKVVQMRDIKIIKLLLLTGQLSHLFKADSIGDIVERLAVDRNDPGLLMLLTRRTRKELSYKALMFLVHSWSLKLQSAKNKALAKKRPVSAGTTEDKEEDMEVYLVKYVRAGRNPLSVVSAILQAIKDEMMQYDESRRFLEEPYRKFHTFSISMLDEMVEKDVALPALHRLLHPSEVPTTVHDISPLEVAFNGMDLDFVSHDVLFTFVKQSWQGRRFMGLTCNEDERAISLRNPLFGYRVLRSAGFHPGPSKPVLKYGMSLWQTCSFCSLAFFNSPRGRWSMHALCETGFLALFQWILLYPTAAARPGAVLAFLLFVFGNFLDILNYTRLKYGSIAQMGVYLVDSWNLLNFVTNAILLVLVAILTGDYWINTEVLWANDPYSWLHIALCTTSVLVWIRFLSLVQPVYPRLGPLLITVGKMMGEIVAFAVPYGFVLSGFATLFSGIYSEAIEDYGSWWMSMLTLFKSMLGGYSFDDFKTDADGNPLPMYLTLYGYLLLVIYLIMIAILLLNLLVAIIVARYDPDSNESLAQFRAAQIVDAYRIQVRHNIVCSPLNLVHYALFWVPNFERHPTTLKVARLLALVNPDGDLHPDIHFLLPSGRGEFPHFAFLLTTYPIMWATSVACYFLCAPFTIWSFGYDRWEVFTKRYLRAAKVSNSPAADNAALVTYLRRPFEQIQGTMTQQQQREAARAIEYILQIPVTFAAMLVGAIMYLVVLGAGMLTIWMGLVWWLWKLLFSVHMMTIYPWYRALDTLFRFRRKRDDEAADQEGERSLWWRTPADPDGQEAAPREAADLQPPTTPHVAANVASKWRTAKDLVVEYMSVHDPMDQQSVDRALNRSAFAPDLMDWKLPVIDMSATRRGISERDKDDMTDPATRGEIQELRNMLHDLTQLQKDVDMRMRAMEGRAATPAKQGPSSSAMS